MRWANHSVENGIRGWLASRGIRRGGKTVAGSLQAAAEKEEDIPKNPPAVPVQENFFIQDIAPMRFRLQNCVRQSSHITKFLSLEGR